MTFKVYRILAIIASISLLLTACKKEENKHINIREEFAKGFYVDNQKPLESITKTYELQELREFFGQIPPNESSMYSSSDDYNKLRINQVNEKFPIECIRLNGMIGYYTVYKVNEGGYFYVFWSLLDDPNQDYDSDLKPIDAQVYFAAHLLSLKKANDFDSIKAGKSTAEDVSKIDPAFELSFLFSSGIRSFSLLEDGSIMMIMYEDSDHIESRKDLIVKSKKIYSKDNFLGGSYLSCILSSDLP